MLIAQKYRGQSVRNQAPAVSNTSTWDMFRPAGLALYGRLNRKSVVSPEAVPLRSVPPASGIVSI
eukprot:1996147-Pleurochrysis_carterae.AAC.1